MVGARASADAVLRRFDDAEPGALESGQNLEGADKAVAVRDVRGRGFGEHGAGQDGTERDRTRGRWEHRGVTRGRVGRGAVYGCDQRDHLLRPSRFAQGARGVSRAPFWLLTPPSERSALTRPGRGERSLARAWTPRVPTPTRRRGRMRQREVKRWAADVRPTAWRSAASQSRPTRPRGLPSATEGDGRPTRRGERPVGAACGSRGHDRPRTDGLKRPAKTRSPQPGLSANARWFQDGLRSPCGTSSLVDAARATRSYLEYRDRPSWRGIPCCTLSHQIPPCCTCDVEPRRNSVMGALFRARAEAASQAAKPVEPERNRVQHGVPPVSA